MAATWTRRRVLRLGLALPVGTCATLSGCTLSDPAVRRPTPAATVSGSSASPVVPVPPAYLAAASTELDLAAQAMAVLTGRRSGLNAEQERLLDFISEAHRSHAAVLSRNPVRPTPAPTSSGTASPRPTGTVKQALARLADGESTTAGAWRRAALAASGLEALTWGSLAVAGTRFAAGLTAANPPPVGTVGTPAPVLVLAETAAVQEVVRQLHAMVYGYQLAIGRLPVLGSNHPRAVKELLAHRKLRDELIDELVSIGAEVPVAEPAYVPPVAPRDGATSGRLIRRMQIAFQPFCGLWLAAATTTTERRRALNALATASARARTWGGPLTAWPGYSAT